MAKNSLTSAKDIKLKIKDSEKTLNWVNPKKYIPRHIMSNFCKLRTNKKIPEIRTRNDTLSIGGN